MLADVAISWWQQLFSVRNKYLYFALAAALFCYITYMIIRKRKGARDGHAAEPEI